MQLFLFSSGSLEIVFWPLILSVVSFPVDHHCHGRLIAERKKMPGEIPWRKERPNGEAERRKVTRKVHSH